MKEKMKKLLRDITVKYGLKKLSFTQGDLVKPEHADTVYEVAAIYLDQQLNPVVFVRDAESRLYGIDPIGLKKYGGSKNV